MLHYFKDCSLFQQLLIPMVLVGLVSIVITIYSARELERSVAALGINFNVREDRLKNLEDMESDLAYYRTLTLKHLIAESYDKILSIEGKLKQTRNIIVHYDAVKYDQSPDFNQSGGRSNDALQGALKRYFEKINTALALSADFEKELAFDIWTEAENLLMPKINTSIQLLIGEEFRDFQSSSEKLMYAASRNLYITMSLGIGSGMLLLAIAFVVTRRITLRLGRLLSWAQGFSAGELPSPLATDSTDEVGRLTDAMDNMARKIHRAHGDLADAKVNAEKTANTLRIYAEAFENSGEAILITDKHNKIMNVNAAFVKQTEYELAEVAGKDPSFFASGQTSDSTYKDMWISLKKHSYWQGEVWDRKKSGGIYPKWISISAIRDEQNEISFYIASFTDITERKQAEDRIEYLAHHDILTGILNRFSLEDRMEQALAMAKRRGEKVAVFFIDLDRFKSINDSLGHHVGDKLLVEVAARLKGKIRESDILSRLGGDEFVVALTGVTNTNYVAHAAENIRDALTRTYLIEGRKLDITPSIGISLFPDDGNDANELIKAADIAMFHAKGERQGQYHFYTESMLIAAKERIEIEHEIRNALISEQFELHYQPQVQVSDNSIFRFEALARWRHPTKGMVSPEIFIPIAEESGLIFQLGEWVLNEACRQITVWRERFPYTITISVNLSVKQLQSETLVEMLRKTMEKHDISEGELELEITETAAMDDPVMGVERLTALRELGVTLAIDDFGTGYSSLAYLKELPIQLLKLDRVFVRDIEYQGRDAKICSATLALAHNLGLHVVAEGVENTLQRDFLIHNKCDYLQGYLFGKPLPAKETEAFILSNSGQMRNQEWADDCSDFA